MKAVHLKVNPNDAWAEVELWRWQNGRLPSQTNIGKLEIEKGLRNMAKALRGPADKMPNPFNVASVLEYVSTRIKLK